MEIRLTDFPTATPEVIAGLAFVAEGPVGSLTFEFGCVGDSVRPLEASGERLGRTRLRSCSQLHAELSRQAADCFVG